MSMSIFRSILEQQSGTRGTCSTLYGIRPHRPMTQKEYAEHKAFVEAWVNSPQAQEMLARTVAELKQQLCHTHYIRTTVRVSPRTRAVTSIGKTAAG